MIADFGFDLHMYPLDRDEPNRKLRGLTLHRPTPIETSASVALAPSATVKVPIAVRARQFVRLAISDPGEARRRVLARLLASVGKVPIAVRAYRFARLAITDPREAHRRVSARLPWRRSGPAPAGADGLQTTAVPVVMDPGINPHERIRLGRDDESVEAVDALHGPRVLASVIRDLRPDLIHSMEFQHAGYLVLAARDLLLQDDPNFPFPTWLATNWGSDIYHFGKDPAHARQIRRMCAAINLYSCECHRDLELGRSFGYRGPQLPVLPNSGGMDIAHILSLRDQTPPSHRKVIMVKGYDHFAGRAMTSLAVLERFASELKGYTIVLFSVGARPRVRALELAAEGVLDIKIIDWATHDEILAYFGRARMYLGISLSDAISTSVLEAMAMGAFPLQTNTSCCEEWFISGETGFAIPPDDFEVICGKFARALSDDALVDRAAELNFEIIRSRLAVEILRPRIHDFYDQAFSHAHRRKRRS
jgi:glycosyltransferase involved in cell wall biosynthesis